MEEAFEVLDETSEGSSSSVKAAFPLFMRKDFEVPVNNCAYEIGVDRSYPAPLREMISAAAVTYQLQNKSIDNVRRTYLKDISYEEDPGSDSRLDRPYRNICISIMDHALDILRMYPGLVKRDAILGEWIGDLTFLRATYSLERAFSEADKGALFEAVAIARMILEQISWALEVRNVGDVDQIRKVRVTRSITSASKKIPAVGRMYGWMSDHVHWEYGAHVKILTQIDGYSGTFFATPMFKAIAYSMLIAVTGIMIEVLDGVMRTYPQLVETAEFQQWTSGKNEFDTEAMIDKIYAVSDGSADIMTILKIVKAGNGNG